MTFGFSALRSGAYASGGASAGLFALASGPLAVDAEFCRNLQFSGLRFGVGAVVSPAAARAVSTASASFLPTAPNIAVKRDCGIQGLGFIQPPRAAAPYLQR